VTLSPREVTDIFYHDSRNRYFEIQSSLITALKVHLLLDVLLALVNREVYG
jgi:hypothetical protein